MASRGKRRMKDAFHHPSADEFNYDLLLETLAMCRREALAFKVSCGLRNPAYRELQALVEQIDAVTRLSRVSGAEEIVQRDEIKRMGGIL